MKYFAKFILFVVNQNVSSVAQKPIVDDENSTPAIVYIPDLPADKTNTDLEQVIRSRLRDAHRIDVLKVQCFSHLGIAIVHLPKQKDKDYLINKLQCILLFSNDSIKVTFSE